MDDSLCRYFDHRFKLKYSLLGNNILIKPDYEDYYKPHGYNDPNSHCTGCIGPYRYNNGVRDNQYQ